MTMTESNTFTEKRAHRRIPEKIQVRCRVLIDPKGYEPLSIRKKEEKTIRGNDISLGGVSLAADQALNLGTTLKLEFALPTRSDLISAFADVIWANPSGRGLKFIAIKEEDQKTLKDYIAKIS
jgi:c-di-GMP-binding flagellar brake protein YcgR